MSAKTKIFVLHMKEIIYTLIFILLAVILIVLITYMFSKKKNRSEETASLYQPGVYSSAIALGDTSLEIEVTVDSSHINAIRFTNLEESVSAMYPLMQPSLEDLAEQIYENQSLDDLTYPEGSTYTCELLMEGIQQAIEQARLP